MKKSLVALAALAVAGVASAQSSVTLFGVVDASISGYSSTSRDLNGATFLNPFLDLRYNLVSLSLTLTIPMDNVAKLRRHCPWQKLPFSSKFSLAC